MEYEVKIFTGCTSYGMTVNGKSWGGEYNLMSDEEKEKFVNFLCDEFKRQLKENSVDIQDFVQCFGYEDSNWDSHPCETCGDTTSETIWKFD